MESPHTPGPNHLAVVLIALFEHMISKTNGIDLHVPAVSNLYLEPQQGVSTEPSPAFNKVIRDDRVLALERLVRVADFVGDDNPSFILALSLMDKFLQGHEGHKLDWNSIQRYDITPIRSLISIPDCFMFACASFSSLRRTDL